jgi:hypothetical protein
VTFTNHKDYQEDFQEHKFGVNDSASLQHGRPLPEHILATVP